MSIAPWSTGSLPNSACSWDGRRSGARTAAPNRSDCRRRPIRTPRRGIASTDRYPICRSSRRLSPARPIRRWCGRTLVAYGDAMKRTLSVFLFVACPLAAALTYAQGQTAASPPRSESGLELSALDKSVEPCNDFFEYACGGWIKNNPIPPDRSRWGRFDELQDRNSEILRKVLENAAANATGAN